MTKLRMAAVSAVGCAIALLPASAGAATFSNPNAITINDYSVPMSCSPGPDAAQATPYPSPIQVSGAKGFTTKVTATLHGFSHAYPADVRLLLAGPLGQTTELYNEQGSGTDVSGLTITFDDAAASTLPDPLVSGTFRPSQTPSASSCGTNPAVSLPAPAPSGPYGGALSAFNGINPNGTWNLYAIDDAANDSGSISGGWSLDVSAVPPAQCKPLRKQLKRLKKHHAPHKKLAKKRKRMRQLGC
jgi:hypothetical protein